MFSKPFLKDLSERGVRTFAQALLGFFTAAGLVDDMTWQAALVSAGMAALYAVVMAVAGYSVTGTASFLPGRSGRHSTQEDS